MSINFKIFFEESLKNNENVVLLKDNLLNYNWDSLKNKIIENSYNSYFRNKNLVLKNNNFFLEIIEIFDNNFNNNSIIDNDISFFYFIEKIKEYQYNNPNKNLNVKFSLKKADNIQKSDKDKYFLYLKESLNTIWKDEKEKIKNNLDELKLNNSQINFLNKADIYNEKLKLVKNYNNICNKCLSINFYGYQYICSYCNNYKLCFKCFKEDNHNKEHNFILFKKPIEICEINKYDNKIIPNSLIFKDIKESFNINFKIANTGEKNLIDCYIGYIKFDKNYLYCEKYKIIDDFEKNIVKEINMKIYFDDIENIDFNIYEGHFRMFNKLGKPFGEILKIKVVNNYVSKFQ